MEVKNTYGGTPLGAALWGATYFKDLEGDYPTVVQQLLEAGAPPSSPGPAGLAETLRWQVNEGPPDIVKHLLAFGADPDLKDESGANAYALAKQRGDAAIIDILEKHIR
jgi:ankyrin repeat protein